MGVGAESADIFVGSVELMAFDEAMRVVDGAALELMETTGIALDVNGLPDLPNYSQQVGIRTAIVHLCDEPKSVIAKFPMVTRFSQGANTGLLKGYYTSLTHEEAKVKILYGLSRENLIHQSPSSIS